MHTVAFGRGALKSCQLTCGRTRKCSGLGSRVRRARHLAVLAAAQPNGELSEQWWDSLKHGAINGPDEGFRPKGGEDGEYTSVAEYLLGVKGYRELEGVDKDERQRVWDAMRASAWIRHQKGEMPNWFNPDWLMQEEAPINRMLRLEGNEVYQTDDTWIGGDDGGSNGKGGSGKGPWREDDPYWPLKDWGDHPMRWWTFAFAALLAIGGVVTHTMHGSVESLWIGGISAAVLSMCASAMSDMTDWGHGPLAVKIAWATCAVLAIKERWFGWQHRPAPRELSEVQWSSSRSQQQQGPSPWGGCAQACVLMCAMYMWTGMSGLDELALPTNPGAVYKSGDVSFKHRIWERWGYGKASMRT